MPTSACSSPGKAEGGTGRPPPRKNRGAGGTRKAHSQETAHPQEAAKPPSQTAPKAGPREGTPEDHLAKTSDTQPRAAAHRKEGHPEHADTHLARAGTEEKNKKTHEGAARTRGEGGTESTRPRTGTASDRHHKATTRLATTPPPRKEKRNQRGGGGQTPPTATPAHCHATGGPPEGDGKCTRRTQETAHPSSQARKKPESRRNPNPHTHTPACQKWRGASGTHARAHTHPNTPTQSGGAQSKPGPNTHADNVHPSHKGRGTSGARTHTHTRPSALARSGGARLQPRPWHTPPYRTPGQEVQGTRCGAHTNKHTPQHLA